MKKQLGREVRVEVFDSFKQENKAEYRRRAKMTPLERCAEFAALQRRMWGEKWTSQPLVRTATWEDVAWLG